MVKISLETTTVFVNVKLVNGKKNLRQNRSRALLLLHIFVREVSFSFISTG